MNLAQTSFEKLSPESMFQVNRVCNDFEARWKAGECPQIESMLDVVSGSIRTTLLHELLPLDVEYRVHRGLPLDDQHYQRRFPMVDPNWLADLMSDVVTRHPESTCERIGKYEIGEEIGRGGMGVVYRAREVKLGREVAFKTLRADGELAHLQRLQSEARAAARLDHPNIVPVYEVGEVDGRPYLAMKLIDGHSLAQQLKDQGWPAGALADPRNAALLIALVADALHHAHQHGIMHRDLKPANILLDASGQPFVCDFGLAKGLSHQEGDSTMRLTETHAIVGTPSYMSPEQAEGDRQLTTSTDVYSLGAILYELLSGQPPFPGTSSYDIVQRVIEQPPTPPSRLARGLPRDLETICLKCLEKAPQQRYESARDLAADLRCFVDGMPISARPVGVWEHGARLARRYPAMTATLMAMVIVVVTGFALVSWKWRSERYANSQMHHALQKAEMAHFVSLIDRAKRHLEDQDYHEAQRTLDRCHPHLRSVEHAYLQTRLHDAMCVLRGHEGPVRTVTSLSDQAIASGGDDATIRIWDVTTRMATHTLRGHENPVIALSASDLGRLASASQESVRVWNADLTHHLVIPAGDVKITAVSIDPVGEQIAIGDDGGHVRFLSAVTGAALFDLPVHPGAIQSLSFGPNAKSFAVATARRRSHAKMDRCEVKIWDLASRTESGSLSKHGARMPRRLSAAFSPSSKYPRLAASDLNTIKIWDPDEREPLMTLRAHRAEVTSVAYGELGMQLASVDRHGVVRVWDAHRGDELANFRGHEGSVHSVEFVDDTIVTGGSDGTVRIWGSNEPSEQVTATTGPMGVCDAISSGLAARIVHQGAQQYANARQPVQAMESSWLNVTASRLQGTNIWDSGIIGKGAAIAISPDGARIACADIARVNVVDVCQGHVLFTLPTGATLLRWTDDGHSLVTAHDDCQIRTWDGATGRPQHTYAGHSAVVHDIACAASGDLASASADGSVRVWRDGRLHREFHAADQAELYSVAVSREGNWIAAGGADGVTRVWEARSNDMCTMLRGGSAAVRALSFSGDQRRLGTLSEDGLVVLWDLNTQLATLEQPTGRHTGVSRRLAGGRPRVRLPRWKLGFGAEPGCFYSIVEAEITWFPRSPTVKN